MKKLLILAVLAVGPVGCMSPNWVRLIPEGKDAHIVVNTIYGTVTIDTRVNPSGTNGLGALSAPVTVTPVNGLLLK